MKMKRTKLLYLTIVSIFLAGCWDSMDIEEKNIVTAVVVDKTETGYTFHVEIATFGQGSGGDSGGGGGGGESKKALVLKAEGKDIHEAREDLDRKSNRIVYLGANQCVIFTENMAKDGIEEYMYRLRQIPEYRKTSKLVVTKEKPEDLLNANAENSSQIGVAIDELLEKLILSGSGIKFTIADVLERFASPYRCYVIPSVGLIENETALKGYSVFHDDKMIGFIDAKESEGLIILAVDKPIGTFVVPYQDIKATIEVKLTKKNTIAKYENNQVSFNIDYQFDGIIRYLDKNIVLTEDKVKGLNQELEKMMEEEVVKALNKSSQEFKCDYFNFYTIFRVKYPELIKTLDWTSVYSLAQFDTRVSVKLDPGGRLDYSAKHK